jgi:hypothetical protein
MNDKKIENIMELIDFQYQSISDNQDTIRAIDSKLGVIFILLIIPITKIGEIVNHIGKISQLSCCEWIVIILFILFWVISFICAIRGIAAIGNPAEHIQLDNSVVSGCFYTPKLYNFKFLDSILNSKAISNKKFTECLSENYLDNEDILKELIFEKMKIAYIRDLKIKRLNFSLLTLLIWLFIGIILKLFV